MLFRSLKPGIGHEWFRRFTSDCFPLDRVIVDGQPRPVPRYYDKLYTREHRVVAPQYCYPGGQRVSTADVTGELFDLCPEMDNIKYDRIEIAKQYLDDNTPDRLRVKEQVKLAQLSRLKRTL